MSESIEDLLGLSPEDLAEMEKYRNSPRECCGRPYKDPPNEVPCSEGCCIELWCPCGVYTGGGWGPVGCPCQDDEDEEEVPA